jgi:hypothetical protein
MSKSKRQYTPGPWEKVRYHGEHGAEGHWSGWHVKQPDSGLADVAYVDDVDYGPEVAEANAALIAAAPDLLAACEALLADVARYRGRGGSLTDEEAAHVAAMQAAVDSARGA